MAAESASTLGRPYWQVGAGVPAGANRLVPDISSSADPVNGAVVIINGSQVVYGGTSWSSPTWAGFCALINQDRMKVGRGPVGLLGPSIYPQLGTANFRDITVGSNATFGSGGLYGATRGLRSGFRNWCSQRANPGANTPDLLRPLRPRRRSLPAQIRRRALRLTRILASPLPPAAIPRRPSCSSRAACRRG